MAATSPSPPPVGQQPAASRFEIYVPREADVRSVLIRDLPPNISKRMGLLSSGERPDVDLAAVTWISPVVLREKALPVSSRQAPRGTSARAFLTAAAGKASGSPLNRQGQFLLPVACSNHAAFKVLRDFLPAGDFSRAPDLGTRQPACAPLGRGPYFSQDAIVIHQGHIFLSIRKAGPGRKRTEPSRGRAESGRCSTPQVPPTPPPMAAACTPGRPIDDQGSSVPSTEPPEKAPLGSVGLRALRVQFGVQRRARVALARLPGPALRTLTAVGCVDLKMHPSDGRLLQRAERKKPGSSGPGRSVECSGNVCAEGPARPRWSRDGKTGVASHGDDVTEGVESIEPASKKTRLVSGGDASAGGVEGGGRATGEGKAGDLGTAEAEDLARGGDKAGDLHPVESIDGDLTSSEGGDPDTGDDLGNDLGVGAVLDDGGPEQSGDDGPRGMGADHFLALGGLGHAVAFDFDQSARDERISRIRAQLSEKEAALRKLARLPL